MLLNYYSTMMMVRWKSNPPVPTTSRRRTAFRPLTVSSSYHNNNNNSTTPKTTVNHRIDTEQLRTQLDQLHSEAQITRSKANAARLRLMRISKTAENLQQRAATDVLVGKETEARELLIQKKKLMQALENTKNRIEVLDRLSQKINEAISLKETQLIGNVTMHPELSREESDHQVRFIPPKDGIDENLNIPNVSDRESSLRENQVLETQSSEGNLPVDCEEQNSEEAASHSMSNNDNMINSLKSMSSYDNFLEHVDGQLRQVESDLVTFLRLSDLILENRQKQMSTKVQQTSGILEDIRSIRGRITSIIKVKSDDCYHQDNRGEPKN